MIETYKRNEGQAGRLRDQRVELRISGDLLAEVRRASAANERSVSATARLALTEHLRREAEAGRG